MAVNATLTPADAFEDRLEWTSSNPEIATVAEDGTVTGIAPGEVTISTHSTDGTEITGSIELTVKIAVKELTVSPDIWDGLKGETFTLTATVLPEDATDKSLSWTSSDPEIASVDDEGNVTLLEKGNCVITVTTLDGTDLSAECHVTSSTGITEIFGDGAANIDVYTLGGIMLKHNCTVEELKELEPGVYIISNGAERKKVIIRN